MMLILHHVWLLRGIRNVYLARIYNEVWTESSQEFSPTKHVFRWKFQFLCWEHRASGKLLDKLIIKLPCDAFCQSSLSWNSRRERKTSMYIVMFAIFALMLHDENLALFTLRKVIDSSKQWRGKFEFLCRNILATPYFFHHIMTMWKPAAKQSKQEHGFAISLAHQTVFPHASNFNFSPNVLLPSQTMEMCLLHFGAHQAHNVIMTIKLVVWNFH